MTDRALSAADGAHAESGAGMDRRVTSRGRWATKRWRRVALATGAVALAFLVWWWLPAADSANVALADVQTAAVRRAPFDDNVPTRATVAPQLTTLVGVVQGGQVQRLLVQDGATVTAGQPLATLANPQLRLDILTREAQIASQLGQLSAEDLSLERGQRDRDTQVAGADYDLIKARRDLIIREQLHQEGFLSDAGLRSYQEEASYQRRRSRQLHSAEGAERGIAGLQARRLADTRARLSSNLAAVRDGMDSLTLRAPATGRLTNFTIQPGQSLKPGDPAGQVDSEGAWKLVADVDQYFLGRVAVGQRATTEGAALSVSKVLPAVTNGRFRVELTFRAPPRGLNRGQAMDATIVLGTPRATIVAPVGGWLDSDGGAVAYVLDARGRHATRRAIRIGLRNTESVEILAGLAPGERIVTSDTGAFNKAAIINLS
ncbi:efflux RND transporter periplasmic adaptor subunit [Sphingomonas folli]|uniref:efflux RND transporter periplasmic adaptor subunit n=1 Tax=Sphingomonas folli TaxID=2862497 RepID=UPI0027E4AB31|nr:HlyD family efflux transporter periplasmic adaptor subunit [Sphingomonas folli]